MFGLPVAKRPSRRRDTRQIRRTLAPSTGRLHGRRLQLEALEQRTLLSVAVATDKTDYAPGDTAVLTASGLEAGETVEFQVLHVDGTPNTGAGHDPWEVTDGGAADMDGQIDGNVVTTWLVNEDDSYGSTFEVTATGLVSGESASAMFYDGYIYYSRYHASGRSWYDENSWWYEWDEINGTPGPGDRAIIGAGAHSQVEWMRVRWFDQEARWVDISWMTEPPDGVGTTRAIGELQIDADQGMRTLTVSENVKIGMNREGTLDVYGTLKTPNLYLTMPESTTAAKANVYLRPGGTLFATNISGGTGIENFQWYGGVIRPYATTMTIDASVGKIQVSPTNTHEFIVPNGKTINLKAALSGSGPVTKSSAGTLNLYSINNAYTGLFTIGAGALALQGSGSLSYKTDLTVQSAGVFDLNALNDVIDSLSGSGQVWTDGGTLTVGGNNGGGTFSGVISGANGSLVKAGSGTQTLGGSQSYTGPTTINGGTLRLAGSGRLWDSSTVYVNSGAVFDLNKITDAINGLNNGSSGGGAVLLGGATLTVGANHANGDFSGVISESGNLVKSGVGTQVLRGANTYGGSTTINAGTLRLAGSGQLPDSTDVAVGKYAFFDLNGRSDAIDGLSGSGTVELDGATLTVGAAGGGGPFPG